MKNRLKQLDNNIAELETLKERNSAEDFKNDNSKEWALRYGLLESIQIIIDISCHLVMHHNLGNADTYGQCIDLLKKHSYIRSDLANQLKGMVGLRNILVHQYVAIDVDRLYNLLTELGDFKSFVKQIKTHL